MYLSIISIIPSVNTVYKMAKKPKFCFIIYDFIPFLGPEDDGGAQELEIGKYESRVSIYSSLKLKIMR